MNTKSKSNSISKSWFQRFDIFGSGFNFLTEGNEKFNSTSGAVLTFIYCVIVVALFMGFGLDLYQRKNPRVSFNTEKAPYSKVNMSNSNFTYAYRVEDTYGQMVTDQNLLYPQVIYAGNELINGSWVMTVGKYVANKRCHDLPNYKDKEAYFGISLENWYCLDFDDVIMGGNWDGNFVYNFIVQVVQCTNSTSDSTCASQETIQKTFTSEIGGGNLFYSDLSLNVQPKMNNFTSPLGSNLVNHYEMLNLQFTRRKVVTFKTTTILNDIGWFFSDVIEESVLSNDIVQPDFTLKDKWTQNILYNTYLYLGNTSDTYTRNYTRVQEVIASIGGFAKFFHTCLFLLHFHIAKLAKNLILIRAVPFNEDSFALRTREGPREATNSPTKLRNLIFKKFHVVKDFKVLTGKTVTSAKTANISYFEYLKKFVCKIKSKSVYQNSVLNKYTYYQRKFNKAFDVVSYMKMYNQFGILKKVLMDKNQLSLFKLLKPKLHKPLKKEDGPDYEKIIKNLNSLPGESTQNIEDRATRSESGSKEQTLEKTVKKEKLCKSMIEMMDKDTKRFFSK